MEIVQAPSIHKPTKSLKDKLKRYFLRWLHLTDRPVVKIYRGYANDNQLVIHGSVFRRSALSRQKYRSNVWVNVLGLVRLFLVKPAAMVSIRVWMDDQSVRAKTDEGGYFRVEMPLSQPLPAGWHPVRAELMEPHSETAVGEGQVLVPHPTPFACISDIDDTFLVSHSARLGKRLKVLLTKNAHTRKPFEGVVAHYQLLAEASSGSGATNPFFYVSSSEWNLYDYILEFSKKNGLPDGVYLLSPLKQFRELLKTGQNKHMTKFIRIVRILEMYPQQQFILLGDDTQEDPVIYASVAEHFPNQIRCVYIRQVHGKNQPKTREILNRIEAVGIPCCYFAHSAEARQHSLTIGLIAS
ncbi:App1 family protein [Spirosoma koreense]